MTIPVSHLPRCTKLHPSDRYACNCGADAQNERAAMLDRVEAAAHSHRVGDASPETAEPTPAADPLAPDPEDGTLCADCKAPRNTIHGALCSLRWGKSPGRVPGPAAPDASLEARRAFDAFKAWCEADDLPRDARWLAVVRAVDASRPGLTEEQARAWAESIGDMIEAHGLDISIIAAALHRASRGETGPASAPPLAVEARFRATAKGAGLPADAIDRIVAGMRPQAPAPTKPGAQ